MPPRFFVQDSEGEDEDEDVAAYGNGGGTVTDPEASLGNAGPVCAAQDVIHHEGPPHHPRLSSSTSISRPSMSPELLGPEVSIQQPQHYQVQALLPQHAQAAENDVPGRYLKVLSRTTGDSEIHPLTFGK